MILLDTHIVLAVLGETHLALSDTVNAELRSGQRSYVSVATIWEIAIKHRIGKLVLSFGVQKLESILVSIDMIVLPILSKHAFAAIGPEPITKDPFDRLLLGVAAAEGMKLLTIDKALMNHPLAWK
jgi:PIN domain nuclease of toxin-antitoxin system